MPGTLVGRILARARRYAPGVRARLAASRRAVLGWVISAPAVWPARAKGAIQRTFTLARRAVGALAHTGRSAPLVARAALPQGRSLVADYLPIVIAQIAAALIVVAEITRDAGRDAPDVARGAFRWFVGAAARSPILALGIVVFGVGTSALAAVLPDPRELSATPIVLPSYVYDRDGQLLYTFEEERRELAKLDDIPLVVQQATIAIEDRTFWTNPGIDVGGIARAAIANLRDKRVTQGGSTITQQLVKLRIVGDEDTFARKLREALLAIRVTQAYSKREILEMYFNQVYYGNRSYGVRTAAKSYFGITDLDQLTLGQAALLGGLPQLPSEYDPVVNPDAASARRAQVLDAMVESGFVDAGRASAAKAEPIAVRAAEASIRYPHVVFRVREQLAQALGSERAAYVGGYRVYTTIDSGLQATAERAVREHVAALATSNVHNAALISLDPRNGQILAYVGSVDYYDHSAQVRGDFDVAGLGQRQVGSTFKLFTYLTALRLGYTPASVLWDVSTNFSPAGQTAYRPSNAPSLWGSSPENGPVTIRQAVRESLNVPAVKLTALLGVDEIIQTARMLGVESEWDRSRIGLAFGIGAGEMTLRQLAGAYQVVANMGTRIEPTLILRIEDRDANVVRDWSAPRGTQAVSPQLAWLMSDLLRDNTDPAGSPIFGSWTNIGRPAALKTGTTDDLRDVLAVGYVPELLTGVWMGNSDNTPMYGISSAMGPGVLWRDFMKEALAQRAVEPSWYARPDGIVERVVCAKSGPYGGVGSGLLPSALCPSSWRSIEKFIAGTEPRVDDHEFFGNGCAQPRAERAEWQADLVRWATAGKNTRLGLAICGISQPTQTSPGTPGQGGRGKRRR